MRDQVQFDDSIVGADAVQDASTSPAEAGSEVSQSLLAGVLNSSHDGIMAFRAVRDGVGSISDFEWLVVNPAAEAIVGRSACDLVGRLLLVEMPGNSESGLFDRYVEVVESGRSYALEHHYEYEGLDHWFLTTAVKMDDGFAVTFRDISDHKRLEKALEFQALHDPLTGLANRALFVDRVTHALSSMGRRGRYQAVLFIDIDRFKVVNDSLGHSFGDELLVQLGERMQAAARSCDTVARFGGDEFVIFCEDLATEGDAAGMARRMLDTCIAPLTVGGRDITVSASVGVAVTDVSDVEPMTLIRDADAAMYRAKAAGGGRVEFFDEALRRSVVARLDVELELRRGLVGDEFRVYYQPILAVNTGRVVSAEALMRWQHPEHGLLSPGRFLAIAEETGLIVPIGEVVLVTAIQQMAQWQRTLGDNAPDTVSVNLAAAQLSVPGFAGFVKGTLADAGISAANLCIEVTETSLIRDPVTAETTLHALAAHGVKIALDDFGTGYSPLSYLRRFPVDIVKIDQSFIHDLGHSSADDAVVSAVIALSHSLGKTVVAEGVETIDQLETFTSLKGDLVQGYYYSRPVPAGDFPALLKHPIGV